MSELKGTIASTGACTLAARDVGRRESILLDIRIQGPVRLSNRGRSADRAASGLTSSDPTSGATLRPTAALSDSKMCSRLIRVPLECEPPKHRAKSLRLVRYNGVCPLCGGRVSVAKRRMHSSSSDLVGRCEDAPNAHVYAFDHINRSGQPLTPR